MGMVGHHGQRTYVDTFNSLYVTSQVSMFMMVVIAFSFLLEGLASYIDFHVDKHSKRLVQQVRGS